LTWGGIVSGHGKTVGDPFITFGVTRLWVGGFARLRMLTKRERLFEILSNMPYPFIGKKIGAGQRGHVFFVAM